MKDNRQKKGNIKQLFFAILPVIIIVIIIILFLLNWPSIKTLVSNNANVISTLIGVISIILSSYAVYYGRKAYLVAQEIFDEGIKMTKEKVLDQLGLELVVYLFIPLTKLQKGIITNIRNGIEDAYVNDLYLTFKNNKLPEKFSFYESHISDIWNALSVCDNQEEAFGNIRHLVEDADKCHNDVNLAVKILSKNDSRYKKLKDFNPGPGNQNHTRNSEKIKDILNDINNILKYETILPEKLGIADKKGRMYKDIT